MDKHRKNKSQTQTNKIFDVINTPRTIIIFLIAMLLILTVSIMNLKGKYKFYSGQISYNDLAVAEIHYYSEPTMTYFFANNAVYGGEDKDIKGIRIKYVVYVNDKEVVLDQSEHEFKDKQKLSEMIMVYSKFKIVDLKGKTDNIFNDDVKKNISSLKLIIDAKTDKEYDINKSYNVSLSKLK